ncbi:MAG TPA: ABC transporter ATP-binding protein [Pseudomonadales bacterium]|nr:ABC transporter ATP-binding protein [Pseudomonadales bacterium]
MIEIEHLQRRFGDIVAVDDLSFTVGRGEVLGFLGPNGAGKSTTMRVLTGYLEPSAGSVRVFGHEVADDPLPVRRRLGYLPEGAPAWGDMTPATLLRFGGRVRGLSTQELRARIAVVVERLDLGEVLQRRIEGLSRGFQRRVGLAFALLHDPELLVLDEPTDGLDPNQKHEVRELIASLAGERTVIVSTHILEEVEAVCSRALIIDHGVLRADDTPAGLLRRSRWFGAVSLRCSVPHPDPAVLAALPGVRSVQADDAAGRDWTLFTAAGDAGQTTMQAVHRQADQDGWRIEEVFVHPGRLDDVFRALTRAPATETPATATPGLHQDPEARA